MLDTIKQALANLFAAKLRSFLAVLGILVGTASVVALVSSGELATQKALDQFKALGTEMLAISLYEAQHSSEITPANSLSYEEAIAMKDAIPEVRQVAPYTSIYVPLTYKGHKLQGSVVGATDALKYTINIQMVPGGGFLSFLDKYEHFCVIGDNIYQQLRKFTQENPIGKQMWLGQNIYTIIGIAKKWPENAFFSSDVNNTVFIPLKGSILLSKNTKIRNIVLILKKEADIDVVKEKITQYIKKQAPDLKLFFRSAKQLIASMKSQQNIFTLLLGFIGSIALLVGGIGVMNIMLVSVSERRREIGIRKAIGARRRDIQSLFLWEAIVLALFGGICGVIAGVVISFTAAYFAKWDFHFLIIPPLIGFIVSATTGIFFGFYPAYRAARLDPITALRYE